MAGKRLLIVVVDSMGVGAMPDAAAYGDAGADTLGHVARAVGGLRVPNMQRLGLGNILDVAGCPPADAPGGSFGKMAEKSEGKDTTTGHWEMMGVVLEKGLALFPEGFPPEVIGAFCREAGVSGVLGNKPASGMEILKELGEAHIRSKLPIVYTSADSVFQIAAHEGAVGLETLYRWSEAARRVFDKMGIRLGRIIARPFVGEAGSFTRTYNRHDYAMPPPGRTVLDALHERGVKVVGVGKIRDIFDGRGVDEHVKTAGNADGLKRTAELMRTVESGLVFVNLVDTDMLYGHRNDVPGYARAVEEIDAALPSIFAEMRAGDLFAMTADHGCDPTHPGTDHTREHVPMLTFAPARAAGAPLGTRGEFCDLGQTAMEFFGAGRHARGTSFLDKVA